MVFELLTIGHLFALPEIKVMEQLPFVDREVLGMQHEALF